MESSSDLLRTLSWELVLGMRAVPRRLAPRETRLVVGWNMSNVKLKMDNVEC